MLADLPARVQACLQDLETLLSVKQIEGGRAILGNLITEIRIHPDGTAEICGDLQGVLSLVTREKFTLLAGGGGVLGRFNSRMRSCESPSKRRNPPGGTLLPPFPVRHLLNQISGLPLLSG